MTEKYIPNPRAIFNDDDLENQKRGVKRFIMGGKSSGIVFDMSKNGIEVNGYYESSKGDTKYANILHPIGISWEEFDKMRYSAVHKNKIVPDFIDDIPDKEYLSTLPIVHINNKKYYIDSVKRERRMVTNPENVYKF